MDSDLERDFEDSGLLGDFEDFEDLDLLEVLGLEDLHHLPLCFYFNMISLIY